MNDLFLKSYAKVNLNLDIISKRNDGFHELFMVNQSVNLYDELKFKKHNEGNFLITSNIKCLENNDNLIIKACNLINTKIQPIGLEIELNKNIPIGAGLGGGSSNCATTLLAINILYDLKLSETKLNKLGLILGADVPFCLSGKTAIVTGIGDNITHINNEKFYYLIIKPDISINTKIAYETFDRKFLNSNHTPSKNYQSFYNTKIDKDFILKNFSNDFELIFDDLLNITYYKKLFYNEGAFFSSLSGSGSSIFGMFENSKIRDKAYNNLIKKFDNIFKCESE